MKMLLAVLGMSLALAAPAAAVSAQCNPASTGAQLVDATLVRPVSLVGAVAGAGVFFASLPLTFLTGTSTEAAYVLVAAPGRFTAGRYLGDYANYRDGLNIYGTLDAPVTSCR